MPNLPEGFRRLGVLAGAVCALAWTGWALFTARGAGWSALGAGDWATLVIVAVLAYAAPWSIVRGIGWAVVAWRARERR